MSSISAPAPSSIYRYPQLRGAAQPLAQPIAPTAMRISAGPTPGPQAAYVLDVALAPTAAGQMQLSGSAQIRITNTTAAPLESVHMRSWANAPEHARRGGSAAFSNFTVAGQPVSAQVNKTVMEVPLGRPLRPGESTTIAMQMVVTAPKGADRSGHFGTDMVSFANLLPTVAVIDDEGTNLDPYVVQGESFYSLASPWQVRLRGPEGWAFATTGVRTSGDTFSTTSSRDFLIVAMRGWASTEQRVDGTTIRVWTNGRDQARSGVMMRAAADSLAYFNRRFGAYDGDGEYEVVGAPGLGGGMEYPGITLNDTRQTDASLRHVVAHETGHQWFYSMVGNNQFDDPWLDESFTSYITSEFLQSSRGIAGGPIARIYPGIHGRLRQTGPAEPTAALGPVRISSPMNVLNRRGYVGVIYTDGARALARLREHLGDAVFVQGMRQHVAAGRHGVVTTADFIRTMSSAAGRDLTSWFAAQGIVADEPDAATHLDPNADL